MVRFRLPSRQIENVPLARAITLIVRQFAHEPARRPFEFWCDTLAVNQVQRLIGTYCSNVDDDGKVDLIRELEEHAADSRVNAFYLTVIADPQEYDLARIECIKILALYPPEAPADRLHAGRVMAQTLWPDEDYLVRQYAAMSLGQYADDDVVFEALAEVLAHDDDVDVRHNALSSLKEVGQNDRTVALLQHLLDEPELGAVAKRTLDEWG